MVENVPIVLIHRKKICKHKSLAYLRKDLLEEWDYENNDKINLNSKKISISSTKLAYWICKNNKNHKWSTRIQKRTDQNHGCPFCSNKTETKLYDWLKTIYPNLNVQQQVKYYWCVNEDTDRQLPFDFAVEDYKLIIELDGDQHFKQISNWQNPEEQKKRDIYKMKCALNNGYSLIRILQDDVYHDKVDWQYILEELIDNFKNKRYDKPTVIYLSENHEYDTYHL
jgi:hypothetical protein